MTSAELARLDQLAPVARPWFEALIRAMQARGYDPFIGTVWRSKKAQRRAVTSGASAKGQTIGWHNFETVDREPASRAVDFRRRLEDGTRDPTTDGPDDYWRALYAESTSIPGMRCLAYKPSGAKLLLNGKTWDPGHVEYRAPHATLKAAVRAESPWLLG